MHPEEFEAAFREARDELQALHSHGGITPVPDEKVYAYLNLKTHRKNTGDLQFRFGRLEQRIVELEKRLDETLFEQEEKIQQLRSELLP